MSPNDGTLPVEDETSIANADEIDVLVYARGRKEYLRAQTKIWPAGCSKHDCAQARISEICELIAILEAIEVSRKNRQERRKQKRGPHVA